jgi:formylglycine-generating enzyme required for sulfatase activity
VSSYPPDWASGWGQDRYGEWLELTLGEATQRMRWIRPGRFLMGSPEDEPGRYGESESPRHEVRLSRGYWLFDTPVTQTLWVAVMGENPSRFVDPKRPVENVSWNDAMEFLARVNARVPDLDLILPTEAQWEYACRAGTDTATYAGPMEILGEHNAPILDAIAWYGGNSGVGFELENGVDSSDWPEKQYEHDRAGTHPVALKRPNAWGLYDMLGNVWEWCADDLRKYGSDAVNDPVGSLVSAERALRGGSWFNYAYARDFPRAAIRLADDSGNWYSHFGIRCARVRE